MASLKPSKQRKGSSPTTKAVVGGGVAGKSSSLADSTLFSLLNVINLDDICHQTFTINAWLSDEPPKELTVNRFSLVKDAIHEFCKEHKIERPSVKIKATKAPISLDSKAALLENHEVIIEDLKNDAKEFKEVEDPRLVNLKALVASEEKYLDSLKITVELYGGLLKNTSLNHLDHQIIFERLKPIQETSRKLLVRLKSLVELWNPDSFVASAFSDFPDILWVYENYYSRLSQAKRLLRQKCKYDGEFFAVVHEINTTAKASLGLLILLPARRIIEYKNYLIEAIECSPEDHDDRHKLKVVIERIDQTLLERKEEVDEVENEFRLIEIQDKFPHDDLGLDEEKGVSGQKFIKQPLGRRRSAPVGTGIKAAFSKTNKSSAHSIDISLTIHSDSGSLSPDNCSIYLDEGAVQLTTGVGSHERYMFLFNDFLLIAKTKSPTHYKLKCRIKLSDMWLADCIEDITESVKFPERSFVIGWPTKNYASTFSSVEERNKWHQALTSNIAIQKEQQDPKSIVIKVGYKESETYQHLTKTLSVGHLDDANKVVQMALDHFNLPNKETNEFQLWVLFKDGAYPLIGHEFPFAIQLNQHREFSIMDDIDISSEITDSTNNNNGTATTTQTESGHNEGQLQFLLKRSRKLHSKASSKRWMRNPIPWKTSKKHSGSKSLDIASPIGKVFGLPLDQMTSEEEPVPTPINELLMRLFRYAPSTPGVFRKTPNQRAVKEMKETIDEEKDLSLEDTSVHAVAGLMKEYLRRLPDAVCCSENYEDFLSSNNITDKDDRIQEIKRILDLLPPCNQQLIKRFICVLYHISKNSENNNMTSFNLAVCVAPSMLRPPQSVKAETVEQAKITAPQFFEFLIDNFPEIFGGEAITVLGDVSEIVVDVPQVNDDGGESEVDLEVNVEENQIKGMENVDNSLLDIKTRPISRSMPSSPVTLRKLMDKNNDTSRRIHAAFYHPKFSPRSNKRRLERSSATDGASNESLTSNEPEPETGNQCVPGLTPPVILTTTTTSAELIEHVPSADDCFKKRSASFNGTEATEAQDNRKVAGGKRGLNFATSQNFFAAPVHVAERVYCVDRRRQPAAPSYKEHMQRQRTGGNNQLSPPSAEHPVGSKSMETKLGTTLTSARALVLEPRLLPLFGSLSPAGSDGSGKRSTGSISSLSSNEDLSADTDANTPSKPDVTQIKNIQDLLDVSGYANPLRINPETIDMISQTEGQWENHAQDDCQDIDDYQRMTMAEETYV